MGNSSSLSRKGGVHNTNNPKHKKRTAPVEDKDMCVVEKQSNHRPKEIVEEPSTTSIAGPSSSSRETTSDVVMITDAMADVRVKYHINAKELGHGHYGVVRKCMDRKTREWYAIKSIRKSKISKIEVLKREIQILKEVKHPHIIALRDVFEDSKYLHLITELCTGGELFDRIIKKTQSEEGHFSEHDAALLVRDILDAIAYCHDVKGIVHRDLKPENFLFLTEADNAPIKIIDFGLSRHDDVNQGIMQTKVGTPYYVAPEVLRRQYTKSCDIWSIGVITYILLCGYPPFYGDSDAQIFDSVRTGRFDFPSPEWDNISMTAKKFVLYLLRKDPTSRPTALQAMEHEWITMHLDDDKSKGKKAGLRRSSVRSETFQKFLAMRKLKKAALFVIASNLTQAEVGSLGDIFSHIDEAGDGVMTLTELDDAISRGSFPQEIQADINALKEELKLSDTDTLNWKAFLDATMDKNLVLREDKIKFAFDHFKHSENYLTLEDFVAIFKSDREAEEIFDFLDSDNDGKISFEDFRDAFEILD